jgi:hypothetical protein
MSREKEEGKNIPNNERKGEVKRMLKRPATCGNALSLSSWGFKH